jgi:proline iminopeptidase
LNVPFRARATLALTLAAAVLLATHAGAFSPPPELEETVTTADGVDLYCKVVGTGPDSILMVHGGPGLHSGYMAADFAGFAKRHALIFYDQRGAGRSTVISDSTRLGLDAHVRDLEAVRAHYRLNQAVLLGHSWGAGLIAR